MLTCPLAPGITCSLLGCACHSACGTTFSPKRDQNYARSETKFTPEASQNLRPKRTPALVFYLRSSFESPCWIALTACLVAIKAHFVRLCRRMPEKPAAGSNPTGRTIACCILSIFLAQHETHEISGS